MLEWAHSLTNVHLIKLPKPINNELRILGAPAVSRSSRHTLNVHQTFLTTPRSYSENCKTKKRLKLLYLNLIGVTVVAVVISSFYCIMSHWDPMLAHIQLGKIGTSLMIRIQFCVMIRIQVEP